MYRVESVRTGSDRACHVEGMSTLEASNSTFGVDRKTVRKMLSLGAARVSPKRAAEAPKLGSVLQESIGSTTMRLRASGETTGTLTTAHASTVYRRTSTEVHRRLPPS